MHHGSDAVQQSTSGSLVTGAHSPQPNVAISARLNVLLLLLFLIFCEQIRLVEGRDRPIDRLAKNVILFGEQDQGEGEVSERVKVSIDVELGVVRENASR